MEKLEKEKLIYIFQQTQQYSDSVWRERESLKRINLFCAYIIKRTFLNNWSNVYLSIAEKVKRKGNAYVREKLMTNEKKKKKLFYIMITKMFNASIKQNW